MEHSITHHTVPRETFDAVINLYDQYRSDFNTYIDQLLWWNERINLVSRDVPRETIIAHIHHSLILHQFDLFKESVYIVDTGTGGGIPGIPLSITNPNKRFLLNDIVSKKVLAVKQMTKKLSLSNVSTVDKSVAELKIDRSFLLVSKHAFKINVLLQLTYHLPWSKIIFYKGINFEDELEGIDPSLSISVYSLFENSGNNFYKDKALIVISRK